MGGDISYKVTLTAYFSWPIALEHLYPNRRDTLALFYHVKRTAIYMANTLTLLYRVYPTVNSQYWFGRN